MNVWILVLVFMAPSGDIHVAHEGKPAALRMTEEQCETQARERLEQSRRQVPWVRATCVEVPGVTQDDRPSDVVPPAKIDRNNI